MSVERWSFDLLDSFGRPSGKQLKVIDGSLKWERGNAVEGTGSIEVDGTRDVDWLSTRIGISHTDGLGVTRPFGVWLPSIGEWDYEATGRSTKVSLMDLSEVLNRPTGKWVSIRTTEPVTDQIEALIKQLGENVSITPSTLTLATPLAFGPTDTWATICTTALAAIGHTPVKASLTGTLTSGPYVPPERTPTTATYGGDAGDHRMKVSYSDRSTMFTAPNVVLVVSKATGTQPVKTGIARNDSPSSPLSTVNRGERVHVEEVEMATSALAKTYAERRLAELSRGTRTVQWTHPVDGVTTGAIVEFRPLNTRLLVTGQSIDFGVGAVVRSTGQDLATGGQ